jgi:hypothetical protein
VVHLLDDRGPVVGQPLDDRELPQRPGPVEALHGDRLGHVEQVAQRALAGRPHPPEVVVEVEVGIDHPAGRRPDERRAHDPLAHAGDEPGAPLELVEEPGPVRCPVEDGHRGDRRAQERVLLDAPHERVGVAHPVLEAHGVVVVAHAPFLSGASRSCPWVCGW